MAYPPYPSSPYATAPYGSMPPPTPKGIKGPLILLLFGAGLCVAAVAVLMLLVTSAARVTDNFHPIDATGSTTLNLNSAQVYGLYGNGGSQCQVVGPDGTDIDVIPPEATITFNDHRMFGEITVKTSGEHTITCTTTPIGEGVYLGRLVDGQTVARGIFGIFAVTGLFIVGVPLTVIGIIWLVVRNSNNAKARRALAAAPPGGRAQQTNGYGPGYPPVA
ncbi:hypothetical protein [Actinomyces qiguomingii]|uniref:hypothetical protein n=1 Tax=Actinomyces qiguomingii TaxID=2057800 RepID=UPI000CA01B6F|nr:hypothetical protein [Actinomyces qiguomingii]